MTRKHYRAALVVVWAIACMNFRPFVYVRGAVAGLVVAIPVVITFVDNVGYPAPVEGVSMRVGR